MSLIRSASPFPVPPIGYVPTAELIVSIGGAREDAPPALEVEIIEVDVPKRLLEIGQKFEAQKDYAAAMRTYERVIECLHGSTSKVLQADAYLAMASVAEKEERGNLAVECYQSAFRKNPILIRNTELKGKLDKLLRSHSICVPLKRADSLKAD